MYKVAPITEEQVLELLARKPGLKQPQILDELRGPLEYYAEDVESETHHKTVTAGDVIPRPHQDLVEVLRKLKAERRADFLPKGPTGGWRVL